MKRIITLALVLSLASPVMAQPLPKKPFHDGRISYENDPDLKRLIGIQEGLVRRLADNNTDLDLLEFAVKNQDENLVRSLLGMSPADEQKLSLELANIRQSMLRKHPEFTRVKPVSQCGTDTDHAFTVLRARIKEIHASESRTQKFELTPPFPPPDQCSWVPYSIALLACAWVGTLTVLFCMVTMWCVYCDTELTRISCPPLTTYK